MNRSLIDLIPEPADEVERPRAIEQLESITAGAIQFATGFIDALTDFEAWAIFALLGVVFVAAAPFLLAAWRRHRRHRSVETLRTTAPVQRTGRETPGQGAPAPIPLRQPVQISSPSGQKPANDEPIAIESLEAYSKHGRSRPSLNDQRDRLPVQKLEVPSHSIKTSAGTSWRRTGAHLNRSQRRLTELSIDRCPESARRNLAQPLFDVAKESLLPYRLAEARSVRPRGATAALTVLAFQRSPLIEVRRRITRHRTAHPIALSYRMHHQRHDRQVRQGGVDEGVLMFPCREEWVFSVSPYLSQSRSQPPVAGEYLRAMQAVAHNSAGTALASRQVLPRSAHISPRAHPVVAPRHDRRLEEVGAP